MKVVIKEYKQYGNVVVVREAATTDAERTRLNKLVENAMFSYSNDYCAKGVARCMDGDEFDYSTGAAIAGAKADLKMHRKFESDYRHMAELLEEAAKEAKKFEAKHREKAECIEKTLDSLTR